MPKVDAWDRECKSRSILCSFSFLCMQERILKMPFNKHRQQLCLIQIKLFKKKGWKKKDQTFKQVYSLHCQFNFPWYAFEALLHTEKILRNFMPPSCPVLTRLMQVLARKRNTDKLTPSVPYLLPKNNLSFSFGENPTLLK